MVRFRLFKEVAGLMASLFKSFGRIDGNLMTIGGLLAIIGGVDNPVALTIGIILFLAGFGLFFAFSRGNERVLILTLIFMASVAITFLFPKFATLAGPYLTIFADIFRAAFALRVTSVGIFITIGIVVLAFIYRRQVGSYVKRVLKLG